MKCAIPICASGIMFAKYLRHYFGTGVVNPSSSQIFCTIILFESVSVPLHRVITAGHEQGGGSTWGAVCAALIDDDEVVAAKSKTVGSRNRTKVYKKAVHKSEHQIQGNDCHTVCKGPANSQFERKFSFISVLCNPESTYSKVGKSERFQANFQNFEAKLRFQKLDSCFFRRKVPALDTGNQFKILFYSAWESGIRMPCWAHVQTRRLVSLAAGDTCERPS